MPYVGWISCKFSPLFREVFLCPRFSPLFKNKYLQIPVRSGTHGHVLTSSWELPSALWWKNNRKSQLQLLSLSFFPRSIRRNTKRTEDSSSSDDRETVRFTKYPTDQDSLYLDHCSTMTEMASSLLNQRSLCSSGMETDLLETFTVPYDEKDGYTVVDGDTESFCVSIDFGLESDDPFVFPTVDEAARKKSTRTQRGKSRSLVSSCGSKRSRASLPAKFGSRNYSKGNGVREVISDTRLWEIITEWTVITTKSINKLKKLSCFAEAIKCLTIIMKCFRELWILSMGRSACYRFWLCSS